MQHNLVPIFERNPCHLILHAGTNNAESCTSREILDKILDKSFLSHLLKMKILDKLLKLKTFISEECPQCQTIYSIPTKRSDKAKLKQLKPN